MQSKSELWQQKNTTFFNFIQFKDTQKAFGVSHLGTSEKRPLHLGTIPTDYFQQKPWLYNTTSWRAMASLY